MHSLNRIEKKLKWIEEIFGNDDQINWQPFPGSPQLLAYHSPADELLFGGQPGPGKTDLLIGLALTQHKQSLILRREATQLTSITARISELAPGAKGSRTIAAGDRLIEVAGCKEEKSKFKFKGRAKDFYGFDEVTEFERTQYEYIKTWNRSADPRQRCRVVATSNPPERQEARWIIEYWAPWLDKRHPNPAQSGEVRYYVADQEVESSAPVEVKGKLITPRSRSFISASITDNPILMASGYDQLLLNLSGSLTRLTAGFFDSVPDDPYQVIPTKWVELAFERWRQRWGDVYDPMPVIHHIPQDAIAEDVARGGEDETTVAARHADNVFIWGYPGKDTPDGATAAGKLLSHRQGAASMLVDVISWGSSAYDHLKQLGHEPIAFNASNKSVLRTRCGQFGFANKRAEAYWKLRENLDPEHGATLALPPLPKLMSDLTAARWFLSLRGIQLEEKEQIKDRLGRSPDYGDVVVMACHTPMLYVSAF